LQLTCSHLRRALANNDKDDISSLLDSGEDINFMWTAQLPFKTRRSIKGISMCRYPIDFAAAASSLEIVQFLVNRGARLDISNALHAAAAAVGCSEEDQSERVKVIEFLLTQGMDINKLEFAGEEDFANQYWGRPYGTPLHYVASWGWPKIVECLLDNGADRDVHAVSYKSKVDYGTALDWQKSNDPDEGMYNRRVLVLLGGNEDKL
jgi:ankyrin repeat protein